MNFLEWTGLRHFVPFNIRSAYHNPDYTALNPSFKIDCGLFDVAKKKSKDYLFVRKNACSPNNARKLKCEFNLTDKAIEKAFSVPRSVAFEPYVKAFPFKILNSILYTNSKLHKIGYMAAGNPRSFCKRESETIQHFFYDCSCSISFWKDFESYYLSLTKQQIHLNLKDILTLSLPRGLPLTSKIVWR